jgi:hypothetical protein
MCFRENRRGHQETGGQGHLPLLTREEHIVHFFRDVHGSYPNALHALLLPAIDGLNSIQNSRSSFRHAPPRQHVNSAVRGYVVPQWNVTDCQNETLL